MVTAGVYDWKQLGGLAFISGKEEHMNTGKSAAVDLVTAKDKGLIATLKNKALFGCPKTSFAQTKKLLCQYVRCALHQNSKLPLTVPPTGAPRAQPAQQGRQRSATPRASQESARNAELKATTTWLTV